MYMGQLLLYVGLNRTAVSLCTQDRQSYVHTEVACLCKQESWIIKYKGQSDLYVHRILIYLYLQDDIFMYMGQPHLTYAQKSNVYVHKTVGSLCTKGSHILFMQDSCTHQLLNPSSDIDVESMV